MRTLPARTCTAAAREHQRPAGRARYSPSAPLSTVRTHPVCTCTAAARELLRSYAFRTSVQLVMRTSALRHAHVLLPERLAPHYAHDPHAHVHRSST